MENPPPRLFSTPAEALSLRAMPARILLLSSDKALADAFEKTCRKRGAEALVEVPTRAHLAGPEDGAEPLAGVVADSLSLREKERRLLLERHLDPLSPRLIFLDPPQATYPTAGGPPLARMQWPLDPAFVDMLPLFTEAPVVFLAESTLYVTGMLLEHLKRGGVEPTVVSAPSGIPQLLSSAAFGEEDPPRLRSLIAPWSGDLLEVEEAVQSLRAVSPTAHLILVDSRAPIHAAEHALRLRRPAFLPRRLFELSADLLLGRPAADPTSLGRILLMDKDVSALAELGRGLMQEGFEVLACSDPADALDRATRDYYHAAVLSAASVQAAGGSETVVGLRQADPNLRIILMVEPALLGQGIQPLIRFVDVGLDDFLLKPLDAARLKFSLSRALDRRHLRIENERLLRELRQTHHELEQRSGFQSKFFAMVAHDVKNPLTAVRGYAEILLGRLKDPGHLRCAENIRSAADNLNALISDLVDFAAIESGKLRVDPQDMDLARVIEEVGARVQVAAQRRSIRIGISVPGALPLLRGDPLRVGQVLQNLCSNAIQYTPEGGSVELRAEPGAASVRVSVRDTGIGISKQDLPRIFERFFQGEDAQTMRRAGFGLGLKIASEIVRAHGSAIEVSSDPGKGSTFSFTLPFSTEAPANQV
jgi:signal transduction histidine kinase